MGRLRNKKSETELSLLCLPNELLQMIVSYLSSSDIIRAFWDINSDRIQCLIQNYLVHFDLTSVIINEEQWIKTYFINQSRLSQCIVSLRLTDEQMKFLSKSNIQFAQLISLYVVQIKDNTVFHIDILKMAPLIRSFAFDFLLDEMSHNSVACLARIIFSKRKTWLEQMEKLSMNHIHIPFGFNSLQSMPNLRHLTINLRYENQLFDLCSYLPNIESFRVDIRRPSSSTSDFSFNPVGVSPYLRKLIISGYFSSPLLLYQCILIYKSSLEYLRLINIVHPELVDGHQLQSQLVQHLSPTLRFHFHLQFHVNMQDFCIDSYRKTFDWTRVMIDQQTHDNSTIIVVSSLLTRQSQTKI
jgi:hypothetical protein